MLSCLAKTALALVCAIGATDAMVMPHHQSGSPSLSNIVNAPASPDTQFQLMINITDENPPDDSQFARNKTYL